MGFIITISEVREKYATPFTQHNSYESGLVLAALRLRGFCVVGGVNKPAGACRLDLYSKFRTTKTAIGRNPRIVDLFSQQEVKGRAAIQEQPPPHTCGMSEKHWSRPPTAPCEGWFIFECLGDWMVDVTCSS